MNQEKKEQFLNYIDYLCRHSTLEKPLWNKEVLRGLKQPGWTYIDGCMMVGLAALYQHTQSEQLLNYIENFVGQCVDEDGKVKVLYYDNYNRYTEDGCDSDPCNEAKVLYLLYEKTKKEKYRKAIEFFMDKQVRRLPRVAGSFWHKVKYPNQIWLDGLYMIQPFFAQYTKQFENKQSYLDILYQLKNTFDLTWEDDRKLMVHGYDGQYDDEEERMIWADPKNGHSKIVWLRACGWYEMALVDVYEIMEEEKYRAKLRPLIQQTIDGLLQYQDPKTKMFWQVVDEPGKEKNYVETSGSAMISYAILKAVRLNALPQRYRSVGEEIFEGILNTYFKKYDNGEYHLGGICIGAGLSASKTDAYCGTYDMYVSRSIVEDDGKAIGPMILAYTEVDRK